MSRRIHSRLRDEDRLLERLSDLRRELRRWTDNVASEANKLARRDCTSYEHALMQLAGHGLQSSCPKGAAICLAGHVSLGLDLDDATAENLLRAASLSNETRILALAAQRRRHAMKLRAVQIARAL